MKLPAIAILLLLITAVTSFPQERDVTALLQESAALIQSGKFADAEPILQRSVKIAPENADAHNLLGIVLDQLNRSADAEREYRTAIRLNPKAVSPLANLGILLAKEKRSDQAIQVLESVLKINPNHSQTIINLGLLYVSAQKFQPAVELLKRAVTIQPDSYDIQLNLGIALSQTKQLDEAEKAFAAAMVLDPQNAEPLYQLGLLATARGEDETAGAYLEKAISLNPDHVLANFMLGELHAKYRQYSKAIPYYDKAVQLDGTKPVYYIRLGGMYIFEKDFDTAFRTFTSASAKFPDIPEIHYFLAITARAKNDPDNAVVEVKRSLALKQTADSNALLGAILSDRNETAEAEIYLRKAISIDPQHFNANRDLGRMLARQAKFSAALPFLQRASTIRPADPDLHYQLFLAYSRLKQKPEADRELAIFKELSGKK